MAALAPPNLELLRTFVVAEGTPTLSAAAAARHVTKSAVSQQLKTLEAQLGVVLFEKAGRNVRPTEAARALASTLRGAFSTIDDSLEAARELQGAIRGDVRIGAPRPFARVWLRPRLAELLRAHHELVLDVAFGIPTDLERALGAGELDLAVLVRAPESAAIETAPLFVETFEAVASPAYLKTHGTPRSAEDFAAHRIIVFDRDRPMHDAWWRATFGGRASPRGTVVCRVGSLDEMLGLAAAGVGIAVLPDYFVAAAIATAEVAPVRPHTTKAKERRGTAARNSIVLAWRRGVVGSARVRAVRDGLLAR
jgi:DNA-binding transcriptional LysR family regulator